MERIGEGMMTGPKTMPSICRITFPDTPEGNAEAEEIVRELHERDALCLGWKKVVRKRKVYWIDPNGFEHDTLPNDL